MVLHPREKPLVPRAENTNSTFQASKDFSRVIHAFDHSFTYSLPYTYLLCAHGMPGTVLGAEDTAENKTGKRPPTGDDLFIVEKPTPKKMGNKV